MGTNCKIYFSPKAVISIWYLDDTDKHHMLFPFWVAGTESYIRWLLLKWCIKHMKG